MIKLNRIRTAKTIPSIFRGERRIQRNKKLLEAQRDKIAGRIERHTWDSQTWGKSKEQLLKESENKCAYCEAPLKVVAYGDVEHYRPKSVYWWLAYNYDNYLASCTLCNQAFKRDNFPLANKKNMLKGPDITESTTDPQIALLAPGINCDPLNDSAGMPYNDFIAAHKKEKPLLVNPYYDDDPESVFGYTADDTLREVAIFVHKTVRNAAKIEKAIVDNYGLNRLELRQLRYEWYDQYAIYKLTLSEPQISPELKTRIETKILQLKTPVSPFCGMIRYFER